jgi:hypothetical protein
MGVLTARTGLSAQSSVMTGASGLNPVAYVTSKTRFHPVNPRKGGETRMEAIENTGGSSRWCWSMQEHQPDDRAGANEDRFLDLQP